MFLAAYIAAAVPLAALASPSETALREGFANPPRDVKAFAAGEKLHGGFTLVPVKCRAGFEPPFCPFFK